MDRAGIRYRSVFGGGRGLSNRDNSPLIERIATVAVITAFSATERILVVFVREAKAL